MILGAIKKPATGLSRALVGLSPARFQQEPTRGESTLSAYRTPQQIASRVFVIAPYVPDETGRLIAKRPTICPCSEPGGLACRIYLNHRRNRSTGPCLSLEVVGCYTHGLAFTLYPPGHVPYGRTPLVTLSPDGSPLGERDSGTERFQDTLFQAALDAAAGDAWPKESEDGHGVPRFPTQQRRLARACLLTGVAPILADGLRPQLADLLRVPGQLVQQGACQIEAFPSRYQTQGKAIVPILEALPPGSSEFDRLVTCGYGVDLWPEPYRWYPDSACLQPPFFRRIVRAPPP